jgi:peroxiredoxin
MRWWLSPLILLAAALPAVAAGGDMRMRPWPFDRLSEAAPEFRLDDRRTLTDLRGRWVVLHFWATWCKPCATELPAFEALHRRWRGRGVEFLAISIDDQAGAEAISRFAADRGVTMPVLIGRDLEVTDRYWGWGVPVTYFVDPQGRLAGRALGIRDWGRADPVLEALTTMTVPAPP